MLRGDSLHGSETASGNFKTEDTNSSVKNNTSLRKGLLKKRKDAVEEDNDVSNGIIESNASTPQNLHLSMEETSLGIASPLLAQHKKKLGSGGKLQFGNFYN